MKLTTRPPSGFTLLVSILPFIDQQPLFNGWNFNYAIDNLYGTTARSATIICGLLCPADMIPTNPIENGGTSNEGYGITSYGGNAGSQPQPRRREFRDGGRLGTVPQADDRQAGLPRPGYEGRRRGDLGRLFLSRPIRRDPRS